MSLDESIQALVAYRLESAREKLGAAEDLLEKRRYKDSVSRSYYAIFTAARALLASKRLDSSCLGGQVLQISVFVIHRPEPYLLQLSATNRQYSSLTKGQNNA